MMQFVKNKALLAGLFASSAILFAQGPSNRYAWAVNSQDAIESFAGTVTVVPGALRQVSVAHDLTFWGINANDEIYRWNGSGFNRVGGVLRTISVGSRDLVWGTSAEGVIWRRAGENWENIPFPQGQMRQVSVASDGVVYGVAFDQTIWRWNGTAWTAFPGLLVQISVAAGNQVWGVSVGGEAWRNLNGAGWVRMDGNMKQVSAANDGEVWGINASDDLVRWNGTSFVSLGRKVKSVSVGPRIPSGKNRVEENDPAITYNGTWTPMQDAGASGGSYSVATVAGSKMTIRFTGDSLGIYRRLDPQGGYATVEVDGKRQATITFYFSEVRSNVPAFIDNLGQGEHTAVLTLTGGKPRAATGANGYIDAVEWPCVPTLTNEQTLALNRVNEYRQNAGLPPVRMSTALLTAAQAHATNSALNRRTNHDALPGTPGFTGVSHGERMWYAGYDISIAGSENINNSMSGIGSVEFWGDVVYHRLPIANFFADEVGFGHSQSGTYESSAMVYASRYRTQPTSRNLAVFPGAGQTEVNPNYVEDAPDPLPGRARPMGYVISIHVTNPPDMAQGNDAVPFAGTVTGPNGVNIPVHLLSNANDTDIGEDNFFMIPQQPLRPNTSYTAKMSGTDSTGNKFERTWSFTTWPNAKVLRSTAYETTATSTWINWRTEGPVTRNEIRYGTTTAYGMTGPAPTNNNIPSLPTQVSLQLTGLTPGTTYHYQILTTDADGVSRASRNYTFTTPLQ